MRAVEPRFAVIAQAVVQKRIDVFVAAVRQIHGLRPGPGRAVGEVAAEAPVHTRLHGMVIRRAGELDIAYVAVAANGPQKVGWQRHIGDGRIDYVGQEIGAIGERIQLPALQQMARHRSHVGHVERGLETDIALDAEAPVVDGGRFVLRLDGEHVGRALGERRAHQGADGGVVGGEVVQQRRLLHHRQYLIVAEAVRVNAEAAAHGRLTVAEKVPGETEARRYLNGRRFDNVLVEQAHSVVEVAAAGNECADQHFGDLLPGERVHAHARRRWRGAIGDDQQRRFLLAVIFRREIGQLVAGRPGGLDVIKAHAHIQRETPGEMVVVLREPFHILEAPMRARMPIRFGVGVHRADQRVGVRVVGVGGVEGAAPEIEIAVEVRGARGVAAGPLDRDPRF